MLASSISLQLYNSLEFWRGKELYTPPYSTAYPLAHGVFIEPLNFLTQNKCFPYWPQPQDPPMDIGKFVVENIAIEDEASYRLTHLKLENVEVSCYIRWFEIPPPPKLLLLHAH